MTSKVCARIQHHPSRASLLPALLDSLDGMPVEVVTHSSDPPNPWLGYQMCLTDPPDCTHLMVLQDDVTVCRNLPPAVNLIAAANPDTVVCLFWSTLPTRTRREAVQALKRGDRYVRVHQQDFLHVVGVLWPVGKARSVLEWAATLPPRRVPERSDDAMCGRWMRAGREAVVATLPSLVEHPDMVESTIKLRRHKRVAIQFIGDADPLEMGWARH